MKEILGVKEVYFETNGGKPVPSKQNVWRDELVKQPNNPTKADYNFAGWYTDNNIFENPWDFNVEPTVDMTLYARWVSNLVPSIPISGITILTDPTKMDYVHGEALNLAGLTVKVEYEDGSEKNVSFDQLASNGLTATPANGTILSIAAHNGLEILVSGGGFSDTTTGTLIMSIVTNVTLSFEQITEGAPLPVDNITISRTGANGVPQQVPISITNPSLYSNIKWEVDGVGTYAGQIVREDPIGSSSFTLNANLSAPEHVKYNTLGGHTLRLFVELNGVEYMRNINFTIVE
ncbi:MAG: InlB B-repeat-containing protein [Treponema sp.]|nr:InlB B-repeat-containing protein [Treponema sp.]